MNKAAGRNPLVVPTLLFMVLIVVAHNVLGLGQEHDTRVSKRQNAVQQWVYEEYQSVGIDHAALLAAMTVGTRTKELKEARATYSTAGVAHILALSGLHIGFVYSLLYLITLRRRHNPMALTITLCALWLYVVMTGAAASTVRAGLMVTLHAMAVMLRRPPMPYNILAAAALLILAVDPMQLYTLGFQLSFLSVTFILFYVPILMPRVGNPLLRWLCASMAVSLAAQIGVTPLLAKVFHQLPTYFLVANIVVVTAAMVIIYMAAAVVMLHPIPLLQEWMAKGLNWLLNSTDAYIHNIAEMPHASIHAEINTGQTVCAYTVLIALGLILKLLIMRFKPRNDSYEDKSMQFG